MTQYICSVQKGIYCNLKASQASKSTTKHASCSPRKAQHRMQRGWLVVDEAFALIRARKELGVVVPHRQQQQFALNSSIAHTHTKTWVPKPIWSWHHSAWRSVIHAQMQQMLSLRFSAWLKMALVLCFTVWRLFKEWLSDWSFMSDFRMQKFTSSVSRIPSFWKWHSILNVQVLDWIYSTVIRWTVRVTVCQTLKLHDLLH